MTPYSATRPAISGSTRKPIASAATASDGGERGRGRRRRRRRWRSGGCASRDGGGRARVAQVVEQVAGARDRAEGRERERGVADRARSRRGAREQEAGEHEQVLDPLLRAQRSDKRRHDRKRLGGPIARARHAVGWRAGPVTAGRAWRARAPRFIPTTSGVVEVKLDGPSGGWWGLGGPPATREQARRTRSDLLGDHLDRPAGALGDADAAALAEVEVDLVALAWAAPSLSTALSGQTP